MLPLFTVVELPPARRFCDQYLDSATWLALIDDAAAYPDKGALVRGAGGIRKRRFALRGAGKRGSLRVFTRAVPRAGRIFLIEILHKSKRANLSRAEITKLRTLAMGLKRAPFEPPPRSNRVDTSPSPLFLALSEGLHAALRGQGRVHPPPDPKEIRCKLGLTQIELANRLGVSVRTLQNWEQGRRRPSAAARVLLRQLA